MTAAPLHMGETIVGMVPHPPADPRPYSTKARIHVRAAIFDCTACDLRSGCTRPVPWDGPAPNRLMAIGEAPGADEDAAGRPFVGISGRLLRTALYAAGVRVEGSPHAPVTFANTVSCHPDRNSTPKRDAMDACAPHLARQMAAVAPDHVLLVGAVPLARFRSDVKISTVRGRPFVVPHPSAPASHGAGLWCYPILHPAAILRDRSMERSWREDLVRFAEMVNSSRPPSDWLPMTCTSCNREVDRYDPDGVPWCEMHIAKGTAGWQASTKRRAWMWRKEVLRNVALLDVPTPEQRIANPT